MPWLKGKPRPEGSGRKAGTPNRMTRRVRETLELILAEPESECRLRDLRDSREPADRSTFWRLAGRLVPNEVVARLDSDVTLRLVDRSDFARDSIRAEVQPRIIGADEHPSAAGLPSVAPFEPPASKASVVVVARPAPRSIPNWFEAVENEADLG